jgi:hypothetical protein
MIRGYHFFFGLRLATLQFICKTGVHTDSWGIRLLRRLSLGRSLRLGTLGFLGALPIHVPSKKRTKLEPTAEKGIFVSYSKTSKDFHIYIPSLRKTVVQRDVRFEEDRAFQRSRDTKQGKQSTPQTHASPSQSIVTQRSGTTGPQVIGSDVYISSQGIVSQSTSSHTNSGSSSGT